MSNKESLDGVQGYHKETLAICDMSYNEQQGVVGRVQGYNW